MTSDDSKSALYDHASKAWQIGAYSSAAPIFIASFASVVGGDGEILREGTTGWTSISLNPRPFPKLGWKSPHDAMHALSLIHI